MNNWISLLLLGLCLVAQEVRWCQCDYLPWMRYYSDDSEDSPSQRERSQEQLDALLEGGVECTVKFFATYKRLTDAAWQEYYDGEQAAHLRNTEEWLSQCQDTFVGDFTQGVASLGDKDAERLNSLVKCMETAEKNPLSLPRNLMLDLIGNYGETTQGVLTFMGQEGAFAESEKKLTHSEFYDKYDEIVVGLCNRVRAKLEPTAEIFRMYSKMRNEWLKGVDEYIFELADASDLCEDIVVRPQDDSRDYYAAYVGLFEAKQLPGDSRWETGKTDLEKRVDAFLATSGQGTSKCNAQFFSQFDSLVKESMIYWRTDEQDSLRKKRAKLFTECRQVFEGELRKSIATLDPLEARKAVVLGNIIYRGGPTRYYHADNKKIGRGVLELMQQLDPSLKSRKLSREQVKEKYEELVAKWVDSVIKKLEPSAKIFRDYLNDHFITFLYLVEGNEVIGWAHRWNFLTKLSGHIYDVLEAYDEFKGKPCVHFELINLTNTPVGLPVCVCLLPLELPVRKLPRK